MSSVSRIVKILFVREGCFRSYAKTIIQQRRAIRYNKERFNKLFKLYTDDLKVMHWDHPQVLAQLDLKICEVRRQALRST